LESNNDDEFKRLLQSQTDDKILKLELRENLTDILRQVKILRERIKA